MHVLLRSGLVPQVEMGDDVIEEVCNLEAYVFVSSHGGVEVEILDVNCHVWCVLC